MVTQLLNYTGKVVMITGAASSIGRAAGLACAARRKDLYWGCQYRRLIPPPKRLESILGCLFRGRNGGPHRTRNVIRLRPSDSERGPRWSNATRTR
jgi:hypothetical protein